MKHNVFLYFFYHRDLLTSPGKLSLAEEIATSLSVFFCVNYLTKKQKFHLIELF